MTCITQYGVDRRLDEDRESDRYQAWSRQVLAAPVIPHCLKCGRLVNVVRAYGREWLFDHTTETLHVCKYRRPERWPR